MHALSHTPHTELRGHTAGVRAGHRSLASTDTLTLNNKHKHRLSPPPLYSPQNAASTPLRVWGGRAGWAPRSCVHTVSHAHTESQTDALSLSFCSDSLSLSLSLNHMTRTSFSSQDAAATQLEQGDAALAQRLHEEQEAARLAELATRQAEEVGRACPSLSVFPDGLPESVFPVPLRAFSFRGQCQGLRRSRVLRAPTLSGFFQSPFCFPSGGFLIRI